MGAPVLVTRDEFTAVELRAAMAKCKDGEQVRRVLALAMAPGGYPRSEAAARQAVDRQTLSERVHRYNAEGIDGLKSRKSPGREPFLTEAQRAEHRELVIQGPDPDTHGVVRWRCMDVQAEVARRWSGNVHVNTIGVWLGELGLTRLQLQPVHPKVEASAVKAFEKLRSLACAELSRGDGDNPVEILFRTKPGSGRKAPTPIYGHRLAPGRRSCVITGTTIHICSVPSARRAGWARR